MVICFDLAVIFAFTKEWDKTLKLTVLSNLIRLLLYYGHERLWNRVRHGKILDSKKLQSELMACRAALKEGGSVNPQSGA
jgi:uncharacterized membrane protein